MQAWSSRYIYKHNLLLILRQMENYEKCEKFEKGLGAILRNVWSHVEAVQTTDIYALMNHIADTIDYSLSNSTYIEKCLDDDNVQYLQELVVYSYLVIVLGFVDQMQENR